MLQMVFAAYLCLSTIIMLNMLIAMMNSTYSLVSSTRASTWRVESLRTALWFERKMPLLKSSVFLRFKTYRRVVDDRPRWYIDYTPEQASSAHCIRGGCSVSFVWGANVLFCEVRLQLDCASK